MPKNEKDPKNAEQINEEPEVEEDGVNKEEPLNTRAQILKDLNDNNNKVKEPGFWQVLGAAALPNRWTEYGRVKSRADTLNKMQYLAGEKSELDENVKDLGNEPGSSNPYKYQKNQAFNRYHELSKEYDSIPLWKRVLTRLLPDSWTHAGRCRKYMGMCNRIMEGDSGLNPYTKEEIGSTKNKDGSQKTEGEMLLDGYKSRYNNLSKEYKDLPRWQRALSYVLPNSWTKAGQLRDKILDNDEKLKGYGFNDEDCRNIKNMEEEKNENKLKEEVPQNEAEKVIKDSEKDTNQQRKEEVKKAIEEAQKAGQSLDAHINERQKVENENIIDIGKNNVDEEELSQSNENVNAEKQVIRKQAIKEDPDRVPNSAKEYAKNERATNQKTNFMENESNIKG